MLLTAVPGATSFEYLRTVDGVLHPTFKEACQQLGLLNDDAECHAALEEATFKDMPRQIRYLFTLFLSYHACTDPVALWAAHKAAMCEDLVNL
jgi:hypothetical protein